MIGGMQWFIWKTKRGVKELSLIKPVIWGFLLGNIWMNILEDFIKKKKKETHKTSVSSNNENGKNADEKH